MKGRQLTPKEFEILFFDNLNEPRAESGKRIRHNILNGNDCDSISIGNWLDQSGKSNLPLLKDRCMNARSSMHWSLIYF